MVKTRAPHEANFTERVEGLMILSGVKKTLLAFFMIDRRKSIYLEEVIM